MSPHDISSGNVTVKMPLERVALYELVWSEPMLKVAARFGVSSSYMARVCTLLNVPRPERGYWAKLAAGKTQKKPPLPDARPGDHLVWSRDGDSVRVPRLLPKPSARAKRKPATPALRLDQHPVLNGAKALFEAGRLSYEGNYLKPAKRLLIDLTVSKTGLDKALSFANQLFLSLEEYGYRVVIAPNGEHFRRETIDEREKPSKTPRYNNLWSPGRETVVYIGTVAIGLSIIEMSEELEFRNVNGKYVRVDEYVPPKNRRYVLDHSWTTKKDIPTGRLCLQAYSPYPRAKWMNQWRETKDHDLTRQIKTIVKTLEQAAVEIASLVEEGERQAKLEHQQWMAQQEIWRREDAERKAAKALKESKEDLHRIIDQWTESNRIEQFFADAERKAAEVSEDGRNHLIERLRRARELIGSVNALDHFIAWRAPDER